MKFKKNFLIILCLILICCVGAVGAVDSNETIVDRDSDEFISLSNDEQVDNIDESVLSIQNERDKSNVASDDEILSEANDDSLGVTNQYLNDIKVSTSDEFYNFVDYLINQNGFKFNAKSSDTGYTIYSNGEYSCKLYDGENYVLPAGNSYFISKNRMSHVLDEYYPDILYLHDGDTYVDELYLGWLKWVENYHFTLNIGEGDALYVESNDSVSNGLDVIIDGATVVNGNSIASSIVDLPKVFDLRNVNGINYVTPVKDQANTGTCWIFSSIAALESYLLKTENIAYDFSENNIKNVMSSIGKQGVNRTVIGAGNMNYALAYFLRWSGPILEEFDKYDLDNGYPINNVPIEFNNSVKHVQGIKYIRARNSSLDNNEIKQAIMDYGGVMTSLFWNNSFVNGGNYYCPDKKFVNQEKDGHAICIIGWDDTYSRNNFKYKPEGDGAFIIKNSWGNSSGNAGFYYVSYYDDALAKRAYNIFNTTGFSFTLVENNTNYGKNYNYNPLGVAAWGSFVDNRASFTYYNNYAAVEDTKLKACGIYVHDVCEYVINVFVDNDFKGTTKNTLNYAGFHTIPFSSLIPVNKGQIFRIEVTVKSKNTAYFPLELPSKNYPTASANVGESGLILNGVYKDIITLGYANANIALHVYAEYKMLSFSNLEVIDISCHDGFFDVKSKLLDSQFNPLKNFKFIYCSDTSNLKDYKTVFTDNNGEAILRFTNGIKIIDNRLAVSFTVYDEFTAPLIKKTVNTNLPEIVECNIESISVSYRSTVGLINVKGNVGFISIGERGTINSLNVKGNVESIIVNNRGSIGTLSLKDRSGINFISINNRGSIGTLSLKDRSGINFISINDRGSIGTLSLDDWSNIGSISTGRYSNIGTLSLNRWSNIGSVFTGDYSTIGNVFVNGWGNIGSISTGSYSGIGSVSVNGWGSIDSISLGHRATIGSVSVNGWGKLPKI